MSSAVAALLHLDALSAAAEGTHYRQTTAVDGSKEDQEEEEEEEEGVCYIYGFRRARRRATISSSLLAMLGLAVVAPEQ